jgi:hypothetical protein
MITLDVEFLSDEKLKALVEQFRLKLKLKDVPVPIDVLIEKDLNIDIIPIPGLQKSFEIEGFITSDFTSIYVDDYLFDRKYYYRYRFTLAHEIGHFALHKKYFDLYAFRSMEEWRNFVTELDPRDHSKMEYQAYVFAGLLLVPPSELASIFNEKLSSVESLINQAKSKGLKRAEYLAYAIDYMANSLVPYFEASLDVLKRRIQADRLDKLL